jgi:hypothetical protein
MWSLVFPYCTGLAVHKKSVTVCRLVADRTGQAPGGVAALRTFGTMTRELLALVDWLVEAGVTHVAIESTGEYWTPVSNLLAGSITIFLVNTAHVKHVPGRSYAPAHARWLATRMCDGLLQASCIPTQGPAGAARFDAVPDPAGARAGPRSQPGAGSPGARQYSAGVCSLQCTRALRAGHARGPDCRADPTAMAALAKRRMRSKLPLLEQALTGAVRDHYRPLLRMQWQPIDFLAT